MKQLVNSGPISVSLLQLRSLSELGETKSDGQVRTIRDEDDETVNSHCYRLLSSIASILDS